jgi:hypothetical protein
MHSAEGGGVAGNAIRLLKAEPRSVFIALNPTNSAADHYRAVCHLCAATPVEVSLWHEKSGRSSGDAHTRLVRVYNRHDLKTKKRRYLNQRSLFHRLLTGSIAASGGTRSPLGRFPPRCENSAGMQPFQRVPESWEF